VVLAAGPGISAGTRIRDAKVLDITPTVLHVLDLPVAEDMSGGVMTQIFKPEWLEKHPVTKIPTYEKQPQREVPYAQGYPAKPASFRW
jgi:hypothetical protein